MANLRLVTGSQHMLRQGTCFAFCPECGWNEISNEGEKDLGGGETRLEVTCIDCGYLWFEVYKSGRCIEIYDHGELES